MNWKMFVLGFFVVVFTVALVDYKLRLDTIADNYKFERDQLICQFLENRKC